MDAQLAQRQQAAVARLSKKNAEFFELEISKPEDGAGDLKESPEHELMEIDREIKKTKRETQLAASLENKVALHMPFFTIVTSPWQCETESPLRTLRGRKTATYSRKFPMLWQRSEFAWLLQ